MAFEPRHTVTINATTTSTVTVLDEGRPIPWDSAIIVNNGDDLCWYAFGYDHAGKPLTADVLQNVRAQPVPPQSVMPVKNPYAKHIATMMASGTGQIIITFGNDG